jgi:hypothetical protein
MTTSIGSAETSLPIDENANENAQSQFRCFNRGCYVLCRLAFGMLLCLAVVAVKSVFFDYYQNCDKSKHAAYWIRSILISAFGFAVQVVIPYRLIIGTRLCKKLAVFLWLLCVGIDASCRATVRYCDIPRDWQQASTTLWASINDIMSWVVVPLCLYIKLGIFGLSEPHRCTRVLLLVLAVLFAIGFDVARYQQSRESSLYQWGLSIPRAVTLTLIVLIYVLRNMNTESQVFLSNPVNRIELVVLYNLLQGVLNDLSYILRAMLMRADQFDFTIMDYKTSWIKVLIFLGYTMPMLFIALIVQQLIKGRVDETKKHLLMFAFTFFQTYLTAMLITSTDRFEFGSLIILGIIIVFRTLIIYVSLIDGFSKIFVFVSNKCGSLCCKERNNHTSNIKFHSTNSIVSVENNQQESQPTETSRLFNPERLATEHEIIAIDRIVERIAAFNCYVGAVIIFLAIHFYHSTAEGQLTVYQNTLIVRASICGLWFLLEVIVTLILIILLHRFHIQLNNLRPQLYRLTSITCLPVFVLIILSYITQTYHLWQSSTL